MVLVRRYEVKAINPGVFLFIALCALLGGCQSKVFLMPSPVGLNPDSKLFDIGDDTRDDNLLYTYYVTNRLPFTSGNKGNLYTIFPSDTLKLGFVVHRVGDEHMSWEEVYHQSLSDNREKDLLLSKEYVREIVEIDIEDGVSSIPSQADGLFDRINSDLDKSFDKDLLVYVHGANSSFYRATAQGAQYYHFTGHNSVVVTFSWPSAENILRYRTDVEHGRKTVPAFTRLLELLSQETNARNINILAYSAGARIVAQGLAAFPDLYPEASEESLRQRLRIGEVYFAAPDTAFKSFINRYPKFRNLVYRTTISLNKQDTVLKWAASRDGMSRLGRPNATELDDDELILLLEEMRRPNLTVLDIGGSEALMAGSSHNSWYSHPWVSTDILLLMLFNADPTERGLTEYWEHGVTRLFIFPEGYDVDLHRTLEKNQQRLQEKLERRIQWEPLSPDM